MIDPVLAAQKTDPIFTRTSPYNPQDRSNPQTRRGVQALILKDRAQAAQRNR